MGLGKKAEKAAKQAMGGKGRKKGGKPKGKKGGSSLEGIVRRALK
ncbi:Hypothetical Protein RradSPS_0528 [Rubrobacter radiotolerans]|uniref:Uncharacterized protein n=1 Tax=Rubrobacter radiotolerans TaxID=42256 RepID=A0A023X0R1_RUBRA|nr:hypothetical protein [Rubrobacter radiotolerans]AHY45811.1 Hypothetical Protein RradSPS_0528 [Rubrobacter radiotolerans]MDX5893225.1 hypothetical protein [Rubrobacter radiotolerans]SMC03313.1 hypothetical protein SAMN00767673_0528 [Rubrobacter radiotolerans DSM 5868]